MKLSTPFAGRIIGGLMIASLLAPIGPCRGNGVPMPVLRDSDRGSLSWIVQARLAAERETNADLPSEALEDVHSLAGHFARTGYLKEARVWISGLDPVVEIFGYPNVPDPKNPKYAFITPILNSEDNSQLAPKFLSTPLTWAAALVPRISKLPSETPVMWTRGLQPDGTWRADSPYGTWGGHVAYADGSVKKFVGKIQGLTKWGTREPTRNITEALPPGTRIGEYIPPPEISRKAAAANQARKIERFMSVSPALRIVALTVCGLAMISIATTWGRRHWRTLLLLGLMSFLIGSLSW
jgi:hypothetical protein